MQLWDYESTSFELEKPSLEGLTIQPLWNILNFSVYHWTEKWEIEEKSPSSSEWFLSPALLIWKKTRLNTLEGNTHFPLLLWLPQCCNGHFFDKSSSFYHWIKECFDQIHTLDVFMLFIRNGPWAQTAPWKRLNMFLSSMGVPCGVFLAVRSTGLVTQCLKQSS